MAPQDNSNFKPMLAIDVKSLTESQMDKHMTGEWLYEVKLDGMRCIATVTPHTIKCHSRNGKRMAFTEKYFAEDFKRLQKKMSAIKVESLILDGELYSKDWNTSMALTPNRVKELDPSVMVSFVAFDIIIEGNYDNPYNIRRQQLNYYLYNAANANKIHDERRDIYAISSNYLFPRDLHVLKTQASTEDILKALSNIADDYISQGFEGIIAKRAGHLYQVRISKSNGKFRSVRSREWIKFKDVMSDDLKVVDIQESDINPGTVGAIVVQYGNEVVSVCGLTHEQKNSYFHHPDLIVGKIVEVKHYGETSNKKLRHPTFLKIREDKDE